MESISEKLDLNQLKVDLVKSITQIENQKILEELKSILDKFILKEESRFYITPDKPIHDFNKFIKERENGPEMTKEEFFKELDSL